MTEMKLQNPENIAAYNEVEDDHVAELVASMRTHGWRGAPIVMLGSDYAITGSHRLAAAIELAAETDTEIEVPTVQLEDLLDEYGTFDIPGCEGWSTDDLRAEYGTLLAAAESAHGSEHEAIRRLDLYLPAYIIDAYGIDAN